MILVAGGTGRLGSLVVKQLRASERPVRVLTRHADQARARLGPGVDVVVGDVRDPATLAPALVGVDVVVSAMHGFVGTDGETPESVDRDGNIHLLDAARQVGAAVVLMSVVGAAPDSSMELFRMKHAAEHALRASGVPWTIVRSMAFLETWIWLMQTTGGKSGRPLVFGRGKNPISLVSARDVSAVVERAVLDPGLRGEVLQIGGVQDITMTELAAAVQAAKGQAGAVRHVPRTMLRLMSMLGPIAKTQARQARSALELDTADMRLDSSQLRARLTGVPVTTAADLLKPVAMAPAALLPPAPQQKASGRP